MKHRAFLAFDITDHMRSELAQLIGILSSKAKGIRWVKPELMHCTLRFFGDVDEELLLGKLSDVVAESVLHQAPIHLLGEGVGCFPNWRYPKILWAGLGGDTEAVISLHSRLEEAFGEFGLQRDPRSLRLHLTLGRAKSALRGCEPLIQVVEKLTDRKFGELNVSALTLYKSVLTKDGPVYTALRKFPFGGR
ncbi:MAG TPA: RNA 2',3'-cyclic phosphodiesterase [bacterium]|nr:RNA 2',3'-cyclic phosphodiesterase [bacterium]